MSGLEDRTKEEQNLSYILIAIGVTRPLTGLSTRELWRG